MAGDLGQGRPRDQANHLCPRHPASFAARRRGDIVEEALHRRSRRDQQVAADLSPATDGETQGSDVRASRPSHPGSQVPGHTDNIGTGRLRLPSSAGLEPEVVGDHGPADAHSGGAGRGMWGAGPGVGIESSEGRRGGPRAASVRDRKGSTAPTTRCRSIRPARPGWRRRTATPPLPGAVERRARHRPHPSAGAHQCDRSDRCGPRRP